MADTTKVLIVDDNEINAMLAVQLIEAFGLESVVAESGTAAIGCVKEQDFAFVLMDHIMPGMNGVEATGIIHGLSNVPIYAMTGDLTERVAAEFAAVGALSAISKPLKVNEISRIIAECVPEGMYHIPDEIAKGIVTAPTLPTNEDESTSKDTLRSFMGTVKGLNYTMGLSNSMGNEDGYLRLLKASSGNIRQYVKMLSEYLENADPEVLKLASHSLKTVFANIGFENLRKESQVIENKAGNLINLAEASGSIASFDEEHQELVNDYISHTMNAALELEDAIAGYEMATESGKGEVDYSVVEKPLSPEEMDEVIEYTMTALDRFEIDYLMEGLDYLKYACCGEERKKIETAIAAVANFDYDEARPLIESVTSLKKGRGEAR